MAYQILYYDRSMARRRAESDTLGDESFLRYPAPTDPDEVACATSTEDPRRVVYGYDGGWHDRPPSACLAREAREHAAADAAHRRAVADLQRGLPHAVAADRDGVTVRMPDGERQTLTWGDLHDAARQGDPDLAAVYAQIEREALALRNRP